MYRMGRDHKGTTLVCIACTHTERVQVFNGKMETHARWRLRQC
jgi:hypothetical protein